MKLTDLEKKILFDSLTEYKAQHSTQKKRHPSAYCEIDSAISTIRSKLKRALAAENTKKVSPTP